MSIHPAAVIEKGAQLGEGVEVGAFAYVASNAVIGEGCTLKPHAVVMPNVTMGAENVVHSGAVIGDTPQDLAFDESTESFVEIGDRNVFRENFTVHRGTKAGTKTVIGDDCYLMANAHVAHNCILGNKVIIANGTPLGGYVEIGDGAFISGNCVIHQFCKIGRFAMMSGNSALSKDLPPFCILRSSEVNQLLGINVVGLKRNGFSSESRLAVRNAYRAIFLGDLNVRDAVVQIEAKNEDTAVKEFIDFIKAAERGVCSAG